MLSTSAAAAVVAVLATFVPSALAVCGSSEGIALITQTCPWPYSGPEQIDTSDGPRGTMQGYNRCNSTTQNQDSLCVNAVANNASDFCIYGPPSLNTIAEDEGETVAYCTRTGYGTRLIPSGAITGLQVIKTPGYIAFGGFFDQTQVNISAGDSGGELDPHGADARGNPIGSLMYSSAFTGSIEQVVEWHMFVGSNTFCFKLCDPSYDNAGGNLCLNTHDTIGCDGNVPLDYNAINGTYSYCQGANQEVPNGSALPIPASSSCVTYASTALFTNSALPTSTSSTSSSTASSTGSSTSTTTASASASASHSASGAASHAISTPFDRSSFVAVAFSGVAIAIGAAAVLL